MCYFCSYREIRFKMEFIVRCNLVLRMVELLCKLNSIFSFVNFVREIDEVWIKKEKDFEIWKEK